MEELTYFFECYFNVSADYDELDDLIEKYKRIENVAGLKALIAEFENIIKTKNYAEATKYIKKYGNRTISLHECEIFIKFLHDRFKDIPNPMKPTDFYNIK